MKIDTEHPQSIEYDYETFIREIKLVEVYIINNGWSIGYHPSGVYFPLYNDDYTNSHRSILVQSTDMTAEVILNMNKNYILSDACFIT